VVADAGQAHPFAHDPVLVAAGMRQVEQDATSATVAAAT
jgi:hypothetical protein